MNKPRFVPSWLWPKKKKGFLPLPGGVGYLGSLGWDGKEYNYPDLVSEYSSNPWVYASVKGISDAMAAVPLKVYREKRAKNGNIEREEVFDHPLVDLLWNPAPRMSSTDFIRNSAAAIALEGQSLWFVENGTTGQRQGGNILMLRSIWSRWLESVKFDQNGTVTEFVLRKDGSVKRIPAHSMIQAKTWNPADDTRGLPASEVARSPVLLEYYLGLHNTMFFKNGATPGGVLTSDQPLDETQRRTNLEAWAKAFKGVKNAFKTAHLDRGTKFDTVGTSAKDGEFLGLDKMTREQVLAIFKVPPVIVGVFDFANYANSKEQLKIFYQFTIDPLGKLIQDAINSQLIPLWYPQDADELYVEFDYSGIDVLRHNEVEEMTTLTGYVREGILSVNEARLKLQMPAVNGKDDLRDPVANSGFGLLAADGRYATKATLAPTRDDQWWAFEAKLTKRERPFALAMADFFMGQWHRIDHKLNTQFVNALSLGRLMLSVRDVSASDLDNLLDWNQEDARLRAALTSLYKDIVRQAGHGAIASVSDGIDFNEFDPRVMQFIDEKVFKIVGVNRTTKEKVRQILLDAQVNGETVSQVQQTLKDTFEQFAGARALTIARTEVVSANNGAAIEGYRQSGVVQKKEWLTTKDDLVRDSHADLEGMQVDLDSDFPNGCSAPGVGGDADEVINCRCTVLPVIDD